MKLAEALLLRADMQTRYQRLRERVMASAVTQEGDKPREDPEKLLRESMGLVGELRALMTRINRTNAKAMIEDGRPMLEAIEERETLKMRHELLVEIAKGVRREPERYSYREIKWVVNLDVAVLQRQADDIAEKLRVLNAKIQETNWKIKLED